MCIPHGAKGMKSSGFVKKSKPQKHIERVSDELFENGDPDFIDERTSEYNPKEKLSFLEKLLKDL